MNEEIEKAELTKEELENIISNSLSKLEPKDGDIIVLTLDLSPSTNNMAKLTLNLIKAFKDMKFNTKCKLIILPKGTSLSIETKEKIIKKLQEE